MFFDYSDAKLNEIVADNEEFTTRLIELQALRQKLRLEKQINLKLEDELNEAEDLQKTVRKLLDSVEQRIRQQFEDVLKWHQGILTGNTGRMMANETMALHAESNDEERIVTVENSDDDKGMEHSIGNEKNDPQNNGRLDVQTPECVKMISDDDNEVEQDDGQACQSSNAVQSDDGAELGLEEDENLLVPLRMANSESDSGQSEIRSDRKKRQHPRPVKTGNSSTGNEAKAHKKMHSCDECGAQFDCKSRLLRHWRIHTGEKPFKCGICEKSFSQKYNLTQHSLIHTAERPFVCNICQEKFRFKYNLADHMNIHTRAKRYKCAVCKKAYRGKTLLNKHLNTHRTKLVPISRRNKFQ